MIRELYSLRQKIAENRRNSHCVQGVPIFMIHHVNNNSAEGEKNLTIRTSEFETFIDVLEKRGFYFIKPIQLENYLEIKACMITFDDMYKDAMENAIPYLEKKRIPYVCFISQGFIDEVGYVDKNDLERLNTSQLCTIGAHSLHHKLFRFLTKKQKEEELSKREHEHLLGCKIKDFAFPYGSFYACDRESKLLAKKEYQRVYSTLNYCVTEKDSVEFLPRVNLNSNTWNWIYYNMK